MTERSDVSDSDTPEEPEMTFGKAYLGGWFSNYRRPCGFWFGPNGIDEAKIHFKKHKGTGK